MDLTSVAVYCPGTLPVLLKELNLKRTLLGGQSFRWFEQESENEFIGVLHHFIINLNFSQHDSKLRFIFYKNPSVDIEKNQTLSEAERRAECASLLYEYFQFNINLSDMIEQWKRNDPRFVNALPFGIRILKQSPFENLLSFICSQNNNVQRITKMVSTLCELYGEKIGSLNGKIYYQFPTLDALDCELLESTLREHGFGYRARFLPAAVKFIKQQQSNGGINYFDYLKTLPVNQARDELLKITGVGMKVADCVLLMSLDKCDVVPVDVHIRKIAKNIYGHDNKSSSSSKTSKHLTKSNYLEISSFFQTLWQPKSGWAQAAAWVQAMSSRRNDEAAQEVDTDVAVDVPVDIGAQKVEYESDSEKNENKRSSSRLKKTTYRQFITTTTSK